MIEKQLISYIVKQGTIIWNRHALERLASRGITKETVIHLLLTGEIIENYPEDKPYPSCLILGKFNLDFYHIVVPVNEKQRICFIITAYKPDLTHFENNFRTRKK